MADTLLHRLRQLDQEYLPPDVELCDSALLQDIKQKEVEKLKMEGKPLPAKRSCAMVFALTITLET